MKHKAARVRSRLDELTFCSFNIRTPAVNGVAFPIFFCTISLPLMFPPGCFGTPPPTTGLILRRFRYVPVFLYRLYPVELYFVVSADYIYIQ